MYDARKLKQSLDDVLPAEPPKKPLTRSNSLYRPLSLAVLNGNGKDKIATGKKNIIIVLVVKAVLAGHGP